ncbi:phage tail protein I [Algicola sagamiensis]|uniref:phage tail protein I n=1 Tax=Algicola sagamiensis TaxID=163869 RepID=UPI00037F83C2|nr:phage tail protein I [Algicola sagamiensis]
MIHKYSVLPDNHSPLERAIELAFYDMLQDDKHPYPRLLSPQQTATRLLPYLAQDRGGLLWEDGLNEEVMRERIAIAWALPRIAGTKRSIRWIFDAFGYFVHMIPWYEMKPEGRPFHCELIAWSKQNEPLQSAEAAKHIHQQLFQHIQEIKSERDVFELNFALGASSVLHVAGSCHPAVVESELRLSVCFPTPNFDCSALVTAAAHCISIHDLP